MDNNNLDEQREAIVKTIADELRSRFAERAIDVAEAQVASAVEASLEVWTAILSRLRSDEP